MLNRTFVHLVPEVLLFGYFSIRPFTTGALYSSIVTDFLWRYQEIIMTTVSSRQACFGSKPFVVWKEIGKFRPVFPSPGSRWFIFKNDKWADQSTHRSAFHAAAIGKPKRSSLDVFFPNHKQGHHWMRRPLLWVFLLWVTNWIRNLSQDNQIICYDSIFACVKVISVD